MKYNLAEIREMKGLTQSDMAEKLAIGISTYNVYENGSRRIPKRIAEKIALILDTDIDNIFCLQLLQLVKY